jgi:hypothetical protein
LDFVPGATCDAVSVAATVNAEPVRVDLNVPEYVPPDIGDSCRGLPPPKLGPNCEIVP